MTGCKHFVKIGVSSRQEALPICANTGGVQIRRLCSPQWLSPKGR